MSEWVRQSFAGRSGRNTRRCERGYRLPLDHPWESVLVHSCTRARMAICRRGEPDPWIWTNHAAHAKVRTSGCAAAAREGCCGRSPNGSFWYRFVSVPLASGLAVLFHSTRQAGPAFRRQGACRDSQGEASWRMQGCACRLAAAHCGLLPAAGNCLRRAAAEHTGRSEHWQFQRGAAMHGQYVPGAGQA